MNVEGVGETQGLADALCRPSVSLRLKPTA
jgi:hypothetical protein